MRERRDPEAKIRLVTASVKGEDFYGLGQEPTDFIWTGSHNKYKLLRELYGLLYLPHLINIQFSIDISGVFVLPCSTLYWFPCR